MRVYVSLDNVSYDRKPSEKEIPKIKKRVSERWQEIELLELANQVGNHGRAIVPGRMEGGISASNCTAMQLLVLDFDHGYTFDEIKARCDKMRLPIAFAYHTFSSSDKEERFRVVFVLEQLINDPYIIKVVIAMLYKVFPQCDGSCKNLDRMFFGGKELIYSDETARIALVQLLYDVYDSMDVRDNFKRNVRTFCNANKIFMVNDRAAMGHWNDYLEMGKIDGFLDRVIIHTISGSKNPSFFIAEMKDEYKCCTQALRDKRKIKRLNIEEKTNCRLLDDFSSGVKQSHDVKFAIASNLLNIDGGKKWFLDILKKFFGEDSSEDWARQIKYMKGYYPQRCSKDFCPYYGTCESAGTIVETLSMDRKIYRDEEKYYSLEEAVLQLWKNLTEAYNSPYDGIHLIKAQTAIGKTSNYIKLVMEHPEMKFLIAVPTNRLKNQVVKDLKRKGVPEADIFVTASVHDSLFPSEISDAVSSAHEAGLHKKPSSIIKEYYDDIKDNPNKRAIVKECEKMLAKEGAIQGERVIVTTHAYFMQMKESFLMSYMVIIDEDILLLHIMNRIYTVSVESLEILRNQGYPEYSRIAEEMVKTGKNRYMTIKPSPNCEPLSEECLDELEIRGENVNDLAYAASYVRTTDRKTGNEVVQYFCPQKLPCKKAIVLSATINENIYDLFFREIIKIHKYPEIKAAYEGNLIQFTYHSLGRKELRNHLEVFDYARKVSEKPELEIITFKEAVNYRPPVRTNSQGFYFGNTTGMNSLSGKDLGIIGTPFKVEEPYKLIACYLGGDVNQEEDKAPKLRRVDYNGCNFLFITYRDRILREVQLYSIQSELEQCVGRARLLRRNCNVYVFSSFPCEQAKIYTKEYLEAEQNKGLPD